MFEFIFKWNRVVAQAVSFFRPRTAEDRVRPQAYIREISSELSLEDVILRVFCHFRVSLIPTIKFALEKSTKGQKGE
jgi:hypothetical protein